MTSSKTSQDRFQQAAAAAQGGTPAAAAALWAAAIDAALAANQPIPKTAFFQLGRTLFESGQHAAAEARARQGLARNPQDFALNNLLGVVLKNQKRYPEALEAFARAEKAEPRNVSPLANRGNVYIDMGDAPRAVETFRRLIRAVPQEGEYQRLLGVAQRMAGDFESALNHFKLARRLKPKDERAWLGSAALLSDMERHDEALELVERGLASIPDSLGLQVTKSQVLRSAGRGDAVRAYLQQVVARQPDAAWAHAQLGHASAPFDRDAANRHFREAVRLAPRQLEFLVALADSLNRTRSGDEGENIEQAYRLALRCLDLGGDLMRHARVLGAVLERCGDFAAADRLGSFEALGRYWALTNQPAALLHHLKRVSTPAERRLLVQQHALWGGSIDAMAARTPLRRQPRRTQRGRIRVGIMSSDLRDHPVTYFALPLLEGYDRSRFAFYCYSWFSREPDKVQQHIARTVDAFRCVPNVSARDAAQLIADDDLDILFELGATTEMNKLEVMAWRPAPVQVSWLGYPHSSGLRSIDHILVDPYLKPEDPALLLEAPFALAHSWVVLGRLGFYEQIRIEPGTPQERSGRITFGTMNNPYKYRSDTLAAWAEVVRRTEGSRFLFVRPEGGTAAFRENMWRAFEAGGVARERVEFTAVRGTHMGHYNAIDIALDTFPQTGGTTTCECLWMGVPVVTLVGEAFFERLSYTNLMNAGLAELCAFDREGYIGTALKLAADLPRRQWLRANLRAELRRQPLGRVDLFVQDFQRELLRVVGAAAQPDKDAAPLPPHAAGGDAVALTASGDVIAPAAGGAPAAPAAAPRPTHL